MLVGGVALVPLLQVAWDEGLIEFVDLCLPFRWLGSWHFGSRGVLHRLHTAVVAHVILNVLDRGLHASPLNVIISLLV